MVKEIKKRILLIKYLGAYQQQKLALTMAIEVGCPMFEVLCRLALAEIELADRNWQQAIRYAQAELYNYIRPRALAIQALAHGDGVQGRGPRRSLPRSEPLRRHRALGRRARLQRGRSI